jgi:uncharacterized Zn finger protein
VTAVVHPAFPVRRGAARATTWWGRAWVRAVEESAYAERELLAGRALARGGHVGGITTDTGGLVAAVEDGDGLWTASVSLPVLDDPGRDGLVETVAAESGRVAALLAGDLPHSLVEHAEEAGVELLPYGGELVSSCTCRAWVDPCVHALAVLSQVAWLLDADPLVLLQLRGLPRDDLLARLHGASATGPGEEGDDLDAGLDAALRAAMLLRMLDQGDQPGEHLF